MAEKATLYQYAAVFYPNEKQRKDGQKAKVVVDPATVLAPSEAVARTTAARAIPADVDLDQVEIFVRPF
jgi:hypothetical protein